MTTKEQLDDIAFFYKEVADLKIDGSPPSGSIVRPPQGWVDMSPDSMTLRIIREQRKPLPPGKWGRLILAPRGATKSMLRRAERLRTIILDREFTTSYNCQNIGMASRTIRWIEGRLARRKNVRRFGEFKNDADWSKEQFTVIRPSGLGDNPTMIAGGPDKDVTGGHPLGFDLDDIVADINNKSKVTRRSVIEWFEALQFQRTMHASMEAIGTWWPGHNLWTEIIDHYYDVWDIILLGVYGPGRNHREQVVWDFPEGKDCFPWLPESYWGPIKERTPRKFDAQLMNKRVTDMDAPFEASFLRYSEPPMKDGRLHPRLRVYMLTDTAQSVRPDAHRTAFVVIAKDVDGMIYVLDIDIGRWDAAGVEKRFFTMYGKWIQHGLQYATIETRGPGLSLISLLPEHARKRADINFNIIIRPVPRTSDEDKEARINALGIPFKDGKIVFSEKYVPMSMFRIDSRGTPQGVAVEEYLNYSPIGDCTDDFMDALSDSIAIIKNAPVCPEPPPEKAKPEKKSDYEYAMEATGNPHGNIIII